MKALAFACALACASCAGSFEEARTPRTLPQHATEADVSAFVATVARCEELDDASAYDSGAAKLFGALAGGSGLMAVPVHDDWWRVGLGIGAAVSAGVAIMFEVVGHEKSVEYVKEGCAK